MTKDQWLTVEIGDALVERSGRRRTVLSVRRTSGKAGQRGNTRTDVCVQPIRTRDRPKHFCSSDDLHGERWTLEKKALAPDAVPDL